MPLLLVFMRDALVEPLEAPTGGGLLFIAPLDFILLESEPDFTPDPIAPPDFILLDELLEPELTPDPIVPPDRI